MVQNLKVTKEKRLEQIDQFFRAANYLGAAQLYLKQNALLERELKAEDIKPRLLGHWGTQPGINLVYAHLNRLIQDTDASILLITGPGHGAPAVLSSLFLEGTLHEYEPELKLNHSGITHLVKMFSWPFGHPSHLVPQTPGQIQEGGELGYSLCHAFGAVLDNPELISVCIVGDGEAETGPLAAAWHSTKFLNPATSGAVLPILHANGYKLSGPTIFGRMNDQELDHLFTGYGYQVRFVKGHDPVEVHHVMWDTLDWAYREIQKIQTEFRSGRFIDRPKWPMIVLQTPKGWTGPKSVDGHAVENTSRSHQLPIPDPAHNPGHLRQLEKWLQSYDPKGLFNEQGVPNQEVTAICPKGEKRMGKNPHFNGGEKRIKLKLPEFNCYGVDVPRPGGVEAEGTKVLGTYLRDIFLLNQNEKNFRLFCPDETTSNRLDHVFEATKRVWMWPLLSTDENFAPDGRVMEILSEHCCEGWLEGYLLTGRHGLFACYEAFIPIVDSMLNQYAKWLKVAMETPWRKPLASLNYLLTSHVWRQDHNGYTHQVPSFITNVANKKSSVARIYLPPDANCLLSVTHHCLESVDYVNLIIASKQSNPQWLDMNAAIAHCTRGVSTWEWASHQGGDPDVVLAAAGDVPTQEIMACAQLLNREIPRLKVRVVNVVDLLCLMSHQDHPHGLSDEEFNADFTEEAPVIFAFHGYPRLIHELLYHRSKPERFHVHGYIEEGRTTTPFDMLVLNDMSRYQLAIAALERVPKFKAEGERVKKLCLDRLIEHESYIREHGIDMPEVRKWNYF